MDKPLFTVLRSTLAGIITVAIVTFSSLSSAQGVLTADEIADLQYMREEEKLARDLYTAFYDLYRSDIFLNIATSEQRHMDAVGNLLSVYGIADPTVGNGAGEFSDTALQDLYDSLLAQGSDYEINALSSSIVVEETDIGDLDDAIASASRPSVLRVFSNLRKGSENHLAAFSNRLRQLDSNASVGAGFGPGDGTSIYEPYSQTLYIPAIDVTAKSGAVVVYDAYLRIVESLPVSMELLTVSRTTKTPNAIHASFGIASGILTIPDMSVGALQLDSLDDSSYTATFHLAPGESGAVFILDTLTPSGG